MKTYPALYIDPNSLLKAGPFPEEPKTCYDTTSCSIRCICGRMKDYQKALQAAKDSAVELDNNYLSAKELFNCLQVMGVRAMYASKWLGERKGEVTRLPDGWGIEVKLKSKMHNGYFYVEEVAVLVPPKSEQKPVKTAEAFLMKSCTDKELDSNAITTAHALRAMEEYADQFKHLPDSGKMVESQTFTLEDMKEAFEEGKGLGWAKIVHVTFDEWIKTRKP